LASTSPPPPPPSSGSGNRRRLLARLELLATALFTLWVVWPLVAPGGFVTSFDTVTYSGPNLAVTLDAVRHGRLATWNPYLYDGVSHIGNVQAAPLYPLKWPFAWMHVHRAWVLVIALHVVLLAGGMFWLVRRRLGLVPPAALVATVTVVGSGALMIRMLFFEQIQVLAWAPWLLGTIDAVLAAQRGRRGRPVAALGVVMALMTIAGHPQVLYVVVPLAATWTVVRAADRHGRLWWRALGPVIGGGAIGALMAAPQLLPAAELAGRSANTGGRDLATISNPGFVLQLSRLAGTWLGDPLQTAHTLTSDGYENMAFVGVVATVLGLVAVVALTTRRSGSAGPGGWRWTVGGLTAVTVAALLLAAGPRLVFYRAAFRLVPGFDQARVPARWSLAAVIATGLLAAYGIDRIGQVRSERRQAAAVALLTAAAAVVVVVAPFHNPGAATMTLWAALAVLTMAVFVVPARLTGVGLAVVAVALTGELALAQRHSLARSSRAPQLMTASIPPAVSWLSAQQGKVLVMADDVIGDAPILLATLRPNANALFGVASVDGYDGGIQVTRAWADAFSAYSGAPFVPDSPARNQLAVPLEPIAFAQLGVRWVMLDTERRPSDTVVPGWGDPVFVDGKTAVYANPAWLGHAWLAPADTARAGAAGGGPTGLDELVVERDVPETLRLAFTAPRAGRVAIAEQWDPGWHARLDGTPVAVVPAGPLLAGVDVAAGEHVLELHYRAAHLRLGLLLWALGVIAVVVLILPRRVFRLRR